MASRAPAPGPSHLDHGLGWVLSTGPAQGSPRFPPFLWDFSGLRVPRVRFPECSRCAVCSCTYQETLSVHFTGEGVTLGEGGSPSLGAGAPLWPQPVVPSVPLPCLLACGMHSTGVSAGPAVCVCVWVLNTITTTVISGPVTGWPSGPGQQESRFGTEAPDTSCPPSPSTEQPDALPTGR